MGLSGPSTRRLGIQKEHTEHEENARTVAGLVIYPRKRERVPAFIDTAQPDISVWRPFSTHTAFCISTVSCGMLVGPLSCLVAPITTPARAVSFFSFSVFLASRINEPEHKKQAANVPQNFLLS